MTLDTRLTKVNPRSIICLVAVVVAAAIAALAATGSAQASLATGENSSRAAGAATPNAVAAPPAGIPRFRPTLARLRAPSTGPTQLRQPRTRTRAASSLRFTSALGYPTSPGAVMCEALFGLQISSFSPMINAFNTTSALDYQYIYWKPWALINGSWFAGPLIDGGWTPEGKSAGLPPGSTYVFDGTAPADAKLAVYHQYWWYDWRTATWHNDGEYATQYTTCG